MTYCLRSDDRHQAFRGTCSPLAGRAFWGIGDCLRSRFNEEWWHHQYAMRDLAVLEQ